MRTLELVADCSRCTGLCCVLLPFRVDQGFGADKPGGMPCGHLDGRDLCSIHPVLRERGWAGCTVFDCFGAGQHLTEHTYAGASWRDPGVNRGEMAAVLSVLRVLHEVARHLDEVLRRCPPPGVPDAAQDGATQDDVAEPGSLLALVTELADGSPDELLALDLDDLLPRVAEQLRKASARLRGGGRPSYARADLAGHDLRTTDLRGADLHGATLIAADLRGCDLTEADLLGADVRDADLRGADLSSALFLTRPQVAAMRVDDATKLPAT